MMGMQLHKLLTDQERAILAGLDSVGVSSIATLADASSLKAYAVRYGLQNILERDLIIPFCSIDPAAIGFSSFMVYFSLAPAPPAEIEKALSVLASHQNVSWVGELSGSFHYGCTVCARDVLHAMSLVDAITEAMSIPWHRKSFTQRTHLLFWPLKLFSDKKGPSFSITHATRPNPSKIDTLDHIILQAKGESPTISHAEIARIAGTSASTVTYRIEQLIAKGIILGSWYGPNWNNLGVGHSEVSLVLKEISPRFIEELIDFGRHDRGCHYVVGGIGSLDFQFSVISSHPSEIQGFTNKLWERYGNKIESITISAYTRLIKYRTYPFRELGGAP